MKTALFVAALGAALASTPLLAQAGGQRGGGWMQQDETRDQAKQRADAIFQRFDLNHDGTVTRDEVNQVMAQMAAGDDSGRGNRAGRMVDRLFGNSQSLTLAQFEAQALARFDAQDLNHDGTVTAAERDQARSMRNGQAPQ